MGEGPSINPRRLLELTGWAFLAVLSSGGSTRAAEARAMGGPGHRLVRGLPHPDFLAMDPGRSLPGRGHTAAPRAVDAWAELQGLRPPSRRFRQALGQGEGLLQLMGRFDPQALDQAGQPIGIPGQASARWDFLQSLTARVSQEARRLAKVGEKEGQRGTLSEAILVEMRLIRHQAIRAQEALALVTQGGAEPALTRLQSPALRQAQTEAARAARHIQVAVANAAVKPALTPAEAAARKRLVEAVEAWARAVEMVVRSAW